MHKNWRWKLGLKNHFVEFFWYSNQHKFKVKLKPHHWHHQKTKPSFEKILLVVAKIDLFYRKLLFDFSNSHSLSLFKRCETEIEAETESQEEGMGVKVFLRRSKGWWGSSTYQLTLTRPILGPPPLADTMLTFSWDPPLADSQHTSKKMLIAIIFAPLDKNFRTRLYKYYRRPIWEFSLEKKSLDTK